MSNINLIGQSQIPARQAERFMKRYENPQLIEVKKLIEKGKPLRGRAIEISLEEDEQHRSEANRAISFALKVKAFAKKNNFPVDATWRKIAENPDRYKVYVYRTYRK